MISRRVTTGDASQDNIKRIGKRKQDKQRTDGEQHPLEDDLFREIIQFQLSVIKEIKKTNSLIKEEIQVIKAREEK